MLRIWHCLDNRLIDGSKVVSATQPPHFTPQKRYYFFVSGSHFCYRLSKPQDLVRPYCLPTDKTTPHLPTLTNSPFDLCSYNIVFFSVAYWRWIHMIDRPLTVFRRWSIAVLSFRPENAQIKTVRPYWQGVCVSVHAVVKTCVISWYPRNTVFTFSRARGLITVHCV
jgi:hypothetical protein